MTPTNAKYPDFVPDQLLTSDNLNQLFGYLDEQGRMTRTNLVGVGIVCGLDVETAIDGSSIKISKGTSVTSEGYLVAQPDAVYTQRIAFDPAKKIYYDKFVTGSHVKRFDMWELKQSAAIPGAVALTKAFLEGNGVANEKKVVVLFVELLEEQNKNCDPQSCDDKGITINVNVRPLLIRKQDVDAFNLMTGAGDPYFNPAYASLDELRMPRFDTPSGTIVSTAGLLSAYKKILNPDFIESVQGLLDKAWQQFSPVVGAEYGNTNPFPALATKFAFVNSGSITTTQFRNLQYVYDHFSDVIGAYAEFRRTGTLALSECCPSSALFPRHLALDLAIRDNNQLHSSYRHYFRFSPLFQNRDLLGRLRSLFRRLVLLLGQFQVPTPAGATSNPDTFIRITPSRLDPSPVSSKAIPYYYTPAAPAANPLFKHWSYEQTEDKRADENLSYHAATYSAKPFVTSPLQYDLEPWNFLRVEGHIGKSFAHVLSNLKTLIRSNRLPIDVIALVTGDDASKTELTDPKAFQDIQIQYETLRDELMCCLKRQLLYWGKLRIRDTFRYGALDVAAGASRTFGVGVETDTFSHRIVTTGTASTSTEIKAGAAAREAKPTAETGAPLSAQLDKANPSKGESFIAAIGTVPEYSVGVEYLRYQENGDYNLSRIPAPLSTFNPSVILRYALIVLDEIQEILSLLRAEDPLALDIDGLTEHVTTLEKTIKELTVLLDKEIERQRPFMKIKAYVGEAQAARVDAIDAAMPDLGEEYANTVVLLLLNLSEADKNNLTYQLRVQKSNSANQIAILNAFAQRLDKDGMMIPANKDVAIADSPFLVEMRERLKTFGCLCTLSGFVKLRALLKKLIDEFKQLNLFSNFSLRHPGLQHKAGVPLGGTFVVVYHGVGGTNKDNPDNAYEGASNNLASGTVVADFYLPYQAYSNYPPIVYQVVNADKPPETVELQLEPNPKTGSLDYSVTDSTPYKFTHTPNGGALDGGTEANGVGSPAADVFVFTPSKTSALLGTQPSVKVTFAYTKMDVSSAPVEVTVHNAPTAAVKVDGPTEIAIGTPVTVTSDTQLADTFKWTVKDPTGNVITAGSESDLKGFPLTTEGIFSFTLEVLQNKTGAVAFSNTVTVTVRRSVDPPPKEVELALEPNPKTGTHDYTVDDANAYRFTHKPEGGDLINGDDINGVSSPEPDTFIFIPARTSKALGDKSSMDFVFNYVKAGVASAPVRATVFNLPRAAIKVAGTPELAVGTTLSIGSDVRGADTFKWTVREPDGKVSTVGSGQALNRFALKSEGPLSFALEVAHDLTGASATSNIVTVTVKKGEGKPPAETGCGSLDEVINHFRGLPSVDSRQFPAFEKLLEELGITAFFGSLEKIAPIPPSDQVDFFDTAESGGKPFADSVLAWMDRMSVMIADDKQPAFRPLALETYQLFTELTLYVSCIRERDLAEDEERIFKNMVAQLKGRGKKGILARASTAEKGKLSALRKTIETELKRREKNRDSLMKPKYDEALDAVLKLF